MKSKLLSTKFMGPATGSMLALVNETAALGFSFKVMVLVVAASLIAAGIEACMDIARMKVAAGLEITRMRCVAHVATADDPAPPADAA